MTDWNLVSGPSDQISVDDTYDPEALIIPGTYYGFGNGYELTETLEPGKGYWVRSTGDGSVSFGGMGLSRTITPLNAALENANIISINGAVKEETPNNLPLGWRYNGKILPYESFT